MSVVPIIRPEAPPPPVVTPVMALQLLLELDNQAAISFKRDAASLLASPRRPVTRKRRQVFWDTADYRLGRAMLALAVDTAGQRRRQLVRGIAELPTGGRILRDHDAPLDGERFDLTRLAFAPGADAALATQIAPESLVPVFAIDLTRTVWRAMLGGTDIALTLERAEIEAAAGQRAVTQLTLALMGGPPQGLYELARRLLRDVPFTLAAGDPVQLGYRLATGENWWPDDRSGEARLDSDMTVRAGFLAIGRAATAALRGEVRQMIGVLEPGRIHQARVAMRRLRSVLSVFGDALPSITAKRLSRALGELAGTLGKAREWDVFLDSTLAPLNESVGGEPCLAALRTAAVGRRERAAGTVRQVTAAPTFTALSLELGSWFDAGIWPAEPGADEAALLDENLSTFAAKLLQKRQRKLLQAGRDLDTASPEQLHALRIKAKKLRYAVESLRSLYPHKATRHYLDALKDIQDILGAANDASVARTLVPQITRPEDHLGVRAAGLIAGWTAAEAMTARRRFAAAWDEFRDTKRFWKH